MQDYSIMTCVPYTALTNVKFSILIIEHFADNRRVLLSKIRLNDDLSTVRQRKSESNYRQTGQSTVLSARSFTEDRFQWSTDCTSGRSISD